jgi:hypothetical protein
VALIVLTAWLIGGLVVVAAWPLISRRLHPGEGKD